MAVWVVIATALMQYPAVDVLAHTR